jgi:DNA-binding response OmpR family regulator
MQKILIVEDDVLFSTILSEKFRAAGFDVRVTLDGEAAIVNLQSYMPNVILLDLLLPQKDGYEVLTHVRKNSFSENIPVIVVSNLSGHADIEKANKLGISYYIVKSMFTPDEVIEKVKESLAANNNGTGNNE